MHFDNESHSQLQTQNGRQWRHCRSLIVHGGKQASFSPATLQLKRQGERQAGIALLEATVGARL